MYAAACARHSGINFTRVCSSMAASILLLQRPVVLLLLFRHPSDVEFENFGRADAGGLRRQMLVNNDGS